jgi:hypothetical protein
MNEFLFFLGFELIIIHDDENNNHIHRVGFL